MENLCEQLKEATAAMKFGLINELQKKVTSLTTSPNGNRNFSGEIIQKPPQYFKMAEIQGIDHSNKTIHLKVDASSYPTAINGLMETTTPLT